MTTLKYLQAYPVTLQEQVRQMIAKDQLGAYLEQRYPERHGVQSDKALYAYALALKQEHLRNAYESQKPLIKLEYQFKEKTQTGNIVAKVRMRPDEEESRVITVASNVPLEKSFTYVINLNKAGLLSVYAADGEWNERIGAAWGAKPLYFKAGAYVQDNSGDSKEGAKVTFDKLDIDHE
jgi:hypothetical protein